jgi:hypothetical protein
VPDGIRVLWTIMRLFKDYRPLSFMSLLAFITGGVGIGLAIPVAVEYFQSGLVPRFPTLIAAVGLLMCAMLLLIAGLILDTLNRSRRQNFEVLVNLMVASGSR